MTTSSNVEYFFLQYVPNVVSGEGVSMAAVFIDPTDLDQGICRVCVAGDWQTKFGISIPMLTLRCWRPC